MGESFSNIADNRLPFAQICMDATGSQAATTIFLLIPILLYVNSVRGIVITAARVLLSLGRDKVMPKAEMWTHTWRGEPIYGVLLSVLVPLLCGAVQLGPSSAFNSLLGGAVIVFELSYGKSHKEFS
jgi:choline transport protein